MLYESIAVLPIRVIQRDPEILSARNSKQKFVYLSPSPQPSKMPPHSHSHSHDANGHRISADTQLATIHATFDRYVPHALSVNNRRRKDYFSLEKRCQDLLPGYATSSLSPTDGSEARGEGGLLKEVDNAIRANGIFLKAMLEGSGVFLAESMDGKVDAEDEGERGGVDGAEAPSEMDFGKLASTLRQCVRDWSVEVRLHRVLGSGDGARVKESIFDRC